MAEQARSGWNRLRQIVLMVTAVLVLALVNASIVGKERILAEGTTVLLRLAPMDPRSLLQGDYMALRYAMANEVAGAAREAGVTDGTAVIELDAQGEARFVAIHDGDPLEESQHLLRFRKRGDTVRLASDAFFFEEGTGEVYRTARFGELRVDASGEALLVGMRDGVGEVLPPAPAAESTSAPAAGSTAAESP